MAYREIYNCPQVVRYANSYAQGAAGEPESTMQPGLAYFVRCAEATKDKLPACMLNYRRQPVNKQRILKRHELGQERRKQLLEQGLMRQKQHLAQVAQLNRKQHDKIKSKWLQLREHIADDMRQHVERCEEQLSKRVQRLKRHNTQVGDRCALQRFRKYLSCLTIMHSEGRKRRGIF